jgi:hypothetical protein
MRFVAVGQGDLRAGMTSVACLGRAPTPSWEGNCGHLPGPGDKAKLRIFLVYMGQWAKIIVRCTGK